MAYVYKLTGKNFQLYNITFQALVLILVTFFLLFCFIFEVAARALQLLCNVFTCYYFRECIRWCMHLLCR